MPPPDAKRPTLWVHIGAGKTGTSSIQATFREQLEAFRQRGCWYLGLTLEHALQKKWPWQRRAGNDSLFSQPQAAAIEQLDAALCAALEDAAAGGATHVVWSNESLLDRGAHFIPLLQKLSMQGWDIRVVAYVRRHDAWARSAYVQWGIKHKTYPGPLWDFAKWKEHRGIEFAPSLQKWYDVFGARVSVRNMDSVGDVVTDFCTHIGVSLDGLKALRVYEMPAGEELILRAIFNNRIKGKALPVEFDHALGIRDLDYEVSLGQLLERLIPSETDLAKVAKEAAQDRAAVNELLAASGQPPMPTEALPQKKISVDESKILATLCQIVLNQADRLQTLVQGSGAERLSKDQVGQRSSSDAQLTIEQLVRRVRSHPALSHVGLDNEACMLVGEVFSEIRSMLNQTNDAVISISGLGQFRVKRIERAGSDVEKRILFRAEE